MFTHGQKIAGGLASSIIAAFALDWRAGCVAVIIIGGFVAVFSAINADIQEFNERFYRDRLGGDQ